jgi:hypothetical protein
MRVKGRKMTKPRNYKIQNRVREAQAEIMTMLASLSEAITSGGPRKPSQWHMGDICSLQEIHDHLKNAHDELLSQYGWAPKG